MRAGELEAGSPALSRLNLAIVLSQLAGIGGCLWGLRSADQGWELALLCLAFALLMNSVYAVIHEAEHGILFADRRLNAGAGALMALFFPAPFHLIRQGHLGHHLRNRSDDEAFDFWFDGEKPAWKRLQFYGILTGLYWIMVALSSAVLLAAPFLLKRRFFRFDRPTAAFMDALNPDLRLARLEACLVLVVHGLLIWALSLPPGRYALLYFAWGWSWSAMQYVHHFGTERHVLRGARNLRIWTPIDWLWLNHNWHRAHHEHPTVPWIRLPALGREQGEKPGFLPWAYLRMWRGPRYTREHVENHYAGVVLRA